MYRWHVTLTRDDTSEIFHTFTWAYTRQGAIARIIPTLESDEFEGWSFQVSTHPVGK